MNRDKKNKRGYLERLINDYRPGKIVRRKKLDCDAFDMGPLFRKYESSFSNANVLIPQYSYEPISIYSILNDVDDVLTPEEIDAFFCATSVYCDSRYYYDMTGLFLSKLLQNSYDAGNNDFNLNTKAISLSINNVARGIRGKLEEAVRIYITGSAGNMLGSDSTRISVKVSEDVHDQCGCNSIQSFFEIKGDSGWSTGSMSKGSVFNVKGVISNDSADGAIGSAFIIGEGITNYFASKSESCEFMTPRQEVLRQLIDSIPVIKHDHNLEDMILTKLFMKKRPSNNKVIYQHSDGSETVLRYYV